MGIPNKDELRGKLRKSTGSAKEKIGRTLGNPNLEQEGAAERSRGQARENIGRTKRKVGDAIKDIGQKIRE
jgi:uncharacterized protein YjbJ (UPF0337 family)